MNHNCSYKDSCFVINNLNGIKKHVEDISVDAVLGCEFCSVLVIYDTKYIINKYIILTTVSSHYHHYHSTDINGFRQVIF